MIDVLVPVLARPANAQKLVDSLAANTTIPDYQVLFLTSPGDRAEFDACVLTGAHVLEVVTGGRGEYAKKINRGFRETISPFVLLAADDIEFTPGWDLRLLEAAASGKAVIGTNDLANRHVMTGGFSTHPVVRRDYIEYQGGSLDGPGVVYHEGYDHNYPDRELAGVAMYRDQWIFAQDCHVIHRHPGWRNPRADSTYKKGAKNFRQDHALFMERSEGWNYAGLVKQELDWVNRTSRRRERTLR